MMKLMHIFKKKLNLLLEFILCLFSFSKVKNKYNKSVKISLLVILSIFIFAFVAFLNFFVKFNDSFFNTLSYTTTIIFMSVLASFIFYKIIRIKYAWHTIINKHMAIVFVSAFFVFLTYIFSISFETNTNIFLRFILLFACLIAWILIVVPLTMASSMASLKNISGVVKTGFGYDVHQLQVGAPLVLCATQIEHSKGLVSFSDGDVAIHALIDALLGAASLGDIGTNFPDTDCAFKNISSLKLLKETVKILQEHNFKPAHVDLTIVAQKPNLSAYFSAMKCNMAVALSLPLENVSIKATTEEHLGFTGAEQGVKAFCVATVVNSIY